MNTLPNTSVMRPFLRFRFINTVCALCSFSICQMGQAVNPPPDGAYPGGNTAEGQSALLSLTTGAYNTAVGFFSLLSNAEGSFNTATGAGTLLSNTANNNTAFGAAALLSNTTGNDNTAVGVTALVSNTTGSYNTATGVNALSSHTEGLNNNAFGWGALLSNTTGSSNNALGVRALQNNTVGNQNVAVGEFALLSNTTGNSNTAIGYQALFLNTSGQHNTAIGDGALAKNTTGSTNTAVGLGAGAALTGDGNICIGVGVSGFPGESTTTRIGNIWGQPGGTQAVYVDAEGRLGMNTSSRRFKEEIRPLDKASEVIYSLKPVSFRYKTEIEPTRPLSFGLIAEDVEQINADLVLRGKDGKVNTVRYDAVNAMLLNEFLKEHRKVQELYTSDAERKKEIAEQRKLIRTLTAQLKEQTAQIQKVSARIEMTKPAPRMTVNER